ncbi:MAG: hypothetical protein HY300_10135 [Verrucomicrobia bacterium]|nr:hypothetical protein [Verrucomicrobiota bacterium]
MPDSIRPTILEKFRVDKPDTIKPDYDTNVRLFRGYDFRVDRLQVSGTCAYCKTGLYGNHRYHTDRSVLVTEEAQPLRPIEERVRELMPTYNPEATNRFERVRPIPIYKPDYGANQ